MSQYSILDLADISEVCRQYSIRIVKSFSVLSGGSENTNYLITTEKGKFVLTICEQKTAQRAEELAYLLEHLAKNGFESSKLIRTSNNALISKWKGKPVMLKVFLEGEIMANLSSDILNVIGKEMGRLHQIEIPAYLPKILNYGIEYFDEVGHYAANSDFELWLNGIKNFIQPFMAEELPKSLIHSDIFFSNIIVSDFGTAAFIMDFEEATNYYRVFDIGMTLVGLCCDGQALNLNKASALLNGYQQEIELDALEKLSLQAFTVYAAAAMTFWRHRNFNHVNPDPAMADHFLGLKEIADFVKEISVTDFATIVN